MVASSYHWTIDQILDLTSYELELLSNAMLERFGEISAGKELNGKKKVPNFKKKKAMKVEDALEIFKDYVVEE